MNSKAKQDKADQVREILRMRFIEASTYKTITEQVGVSRPTARKYIDKFREIASEEDFALKDTYKELKRRVPFPTRWNKYVKKIADDYVWHPKRVATPAMRKKIIKVATSNHSTSYIKSAMKTYKLLSDSTGETPSYETVAKVLREYKRDTVR